MSARAPAGLVLLLVAACGDSAAVPDAAPAGPDAAVPALEIRTVAEPPVGSPFPVVVASADGSPFWGAVAFSVDGEPRALSLYRGLGSASTIADAPGPVRLEAGGAVREVVAATRAQRDLAGTLSEDDLVWDATADVRVTATTAVPVGAVLEIGAGARILVDAGVSIEVRGRVEVSGTEEEPVLFTRAGDAAWGGLRLLEGGTARLEHTWFLAGGGDAALAFGHSSSQPVVFADGGELSMSGGGVIDAPGKAFGSRDAVVSLADVLVSRCDTGGEHVRSEVLIDRCWFLEMPDADGVLDDDDNDGTYLTGVLVVDGEEQLSRVVDSVFAVGEDDGIDHNDALVEVERTWFRGFAHEGVAASGGHSIRVSDSVVQSCEQGIEAGYGAPEVVVDHCLITGCDVGLRYGDSYDWEVSGTLEVKSSIAVGNQDNVHNFVNLLDGPAPDAVSISCSMVDDAEWDGVDGNLAGAPTWGEDGCLVPGSPGEGAACDGGDLGPLTCE